MRSHARPESLLNLTITLDRAESGTTGLKTPGVIQVCVVEYVSSNTKTSPTDPRLAGTYSSSVRSTSPQARLPAAVVALGSAGPSDTCVQLATLNAWKGRE